MTKPIISVVLPVYNEEKFIGECIESILNQTYTDFELIIINDASTDRSSEIINSYNDQRISVINNLENSGIVKSLNKGCLNARGEFIARIDANDIAAETRFEKQLKYLHSNPNCAVVFSPVLIVDNDGNSLEKIEGRYIQHELIQTWLFYKNCFFHTAGMMRKSALPDPPYVEDNFAEDYNLWVDLLLTHELHILDEVLMKVRNLPEGLRHQPECEKSIRYVRIKQLEWLHLYPTRMELSIHLKLASKNKEIDPVSVKETLEWLDKIYIANKKYCVFKEPFFTNKLVEHWLSFVNFLDSPIKIPLFLYIIKSPLRKKSKKSNLRLFINYFPYIRLRYYSNIARKIWEFIWKLKLKLFSVKKKNFSINKKNNIQKRFDYQFKTGFWDYLYNLDELGHYSVIVGYCYYWKSNPTILDVGCGQGILHEKLNIGSYSSYKGIDISSEAILQAAHKIDNNTDFQVANILDFRTKKLFDIIIFCESLYYLDSINEISNVIDIYTQLLEVNGKIIISQFNTNNVNKIWKELDMELILIDQVEVTNRFNLKSTIKVYDAP